MAQTSPSSRRNYVIVASSAAALLIYVSFFRGSPAGEAAEAEAPVVEGSVPAAAAPAPSPEPAPVAKAPELPPTPAPAPTESPLPVISPLSDFRRLYDEGKWRDARRALAPVFADCDDKTRQELATKAIEINKRLLVTHPDDRDVEIAEVQHGDTLFVFARRFKPLHGEYGIVKLVNNIRNDSTLRAGAKLRVPRGTWSILVDKSLFTLWLCYEGTPFKAYRVCIGAEDKTPAAKWTVDVKNPKPAWYAPPEWLEQEKMRNPIAYGHPKNPLGDYWLGLLHDQGVHQGFGIHGTNVPNTIGSRASNGCVRMLNDEVVELARVAWKGMEVQTVE